MLHSRHFKAMQFLYFLNLRKFVFLFMPIYKTLTSALLPLLFVTSMPTVQTLAVLICALVRLGSLGTEKPARVSKIYTPFETYWKRTWVWVTWVVLNCIMWLLWERFGPVSSATFSNPIKEELASQNNPVYYEKGVACVEGVKKESGSGNVGALFSRAQTSPSPSPFNTCHAGYLRNVEIQWPLS